MAFQVRVTQTAQDEINTAYSWLTERDPLYADKWFRDLMDTIATLQEKPRRCALAKRPVGIAPENDALLEEIRSCYLWKVKKQVPDFVYDSGGYCVCASCTS